MGTDIYMGVTITDGPPDIVETLPDFELCEHQRWSTIPTWDAEAKEFVPSETDYHTYGVGRYGDVEYITTWIIEFTTAHPEATVEFTQEWDADGHGEEGLIYRKGELAREESTMNGTVPLDLADMLTEAKAAIAEYDEQLTMGEPEENHVRLAAALRILTEGLS